MSNQLNINPEMDKLARDNGLGHWSCVSPLSSRMWVRSDGPDFFSVYGDNWIDALKEADKNKPIGEDWQQPTEIHVDLTEQEISNLLDMLRKNNTPEQLIHIVPVQSKQQPKQPTLVQKPFKYPCDGALYFTKADKVQVFIDGFVVTEKQNYGEVGNVIHSPNKKYWHGKIGSYDFYFNQSGV